MSGDTLDPFRDYAQALGLDEAELFAGVEHLLNRPKRFPWSEFRHLHRNLGRAAGSEEALSALGGAAIQSASVSRTVRACSLFLEPSTFFMKAPAFVYARYIPFLKVRGERQGEAVLLEILLPEGVPSCSEWFTVTRGSIQNALMFMGLGPARVEFEWCVQGARYLIHPPPSKTLFTRLKLAFQIFQNTDEVLERMRAQQNELWEQNQQLLHALDDRNRALQSRDRFLQTVGHELRTPMNGLRVAIDTHESPAPEVWEIVRTSAERLSATLEAILAYSKYASDDVRAQPRVEGLEHFVRYALQTVAPQQEVELSLEHGWFRFDLEHTRCALTELLRNAVLVAPGHLEVTVAASFKNGFLRIEVRDRGRGVPPEHLGDVFDPFFQLESTAARKSAGLGLGLTLARAAVEGIGGQIGLQPRPGGGTCAWMKVPAASAEAPARPRMRGHQHVLVVDDDAINRKVARRLLEKAGCAVDTAEDGLICLERLESKDYDLILMDCEMPNLDGWATTQELRSQGRRMPVIAATAYTSEADRQRCADSGMDDFLSKPLKPRALAEVLDRWLGPEMDTPSESEAPTQVSPCETQGSRTSVFSIGDGCSKPRRSTVSLQRSDERQSIHTKP